MVLTCNLNQAALFVTLGAKLIRIEDDGTQWQFFLKVKKWQLWYEKHIGIVPYRKFCGTRVELKRRKYEQDGRHGSFRGEKDGFWFNNVVKVVPWTKTDKQKMNIK